MEAVSIITKELFIYLIVRSQEMLLMVPTAEGLLETTEGPLELSTAFLPTTTKDLQVPFQVLQPILWMILVIIQVLMCIILSIILHLIHSIQIQGMLHMGAKQMALTIPFLQAVFIHTLLMEQEQKLERLRFFSRIWFPTPQKQQPYNWVVSPIKHPTKALKPDIPATMEVLF